MNWKQKTCLAIGISIAVGMLIYPPTDIQVGNLRWYLGMRNVEPTITITRYRLIHKVGLLYINWKWLCTQWLIVAIMDCAFIWLLKDKVSKKGR